MSNKYFPDIINNKLYNNINNYECKYTLKTVEKINEIIDIDNQFDESDNFMNYFENKKEIMNNDIETNNIGNIVNNNKFNYYNNY
jgi:hypothetical protein